MLKVADGKLELPRLGQNVEALVVGQPAADAHAAAERRKIHDVILPKIRMAP